MEGYRRTLVEQGILGFDLETCIRTDRLGMLRLFCTIAVVGGSQPLANRRSAALFKGRCRDERECHPGHGQPRSAGGALALRDGLRLYRLQYTDVRQVAVASAVVEAVADHELVWNLEANVSQRHLCHATDRLVE